MDIREYVRRAIERNKLVIEVYEYNKGEKNAVVLTGIPWELVRFINILKRAPDDGDHDPVLPRHRYAFWDTDEEYLNARVKAEDIRIYNLIVRQVIESGPRPTKE
tara:strand:+ start:1001 stop:1315 length:315 start_codon:yes stop_codon:yes gene_type:complete